MNADVFCRAVEDKLLRKLGSDERDTIKEYLSQIHIEPLTSLKLAFKYNLEQVVRVLQARKPPVIDPKEYRIKMIGVRDEDGDLSNKKHSEYANENDLLSAETAKLEALFLLEVGEIYDLSKAIAPKSKLKYNYLLLDSNNCVDIADTRDKFTWLLQEEHAKLQTGYINLHSKMRNIVMARIGRMTLAHMHGNFAFSSLDRNRFAFGFDEFASQALITPEGTKFQFIGFLQDYDSNFGTTLVLSPFNSNRGWFRFRERFKMLDKLTLTITNLFDSTKVVVPNTPLSFPAIHRAGQVFVIDEAYVNPIEIPDWEVYVPFLEPKPVGVFYPVAYGTYIFSGYNSGIPAIDAAWNTANKVLQWREAADYFYTMPVLPSPPGPVNIPFTITITELPRFTGVLELISEDDSDDDTPI